MALLLTNVKLPLHENESSLKTIMAGTLGIDADAILSYRVVRMSIDARNKADIIFNYTVAFDIEPFNEGRLLKKGIANLSKAEPPLRREIMPGAKKLEGPIVVAGLGPAGLFAAHMLAKHGYRPIVLERGRDVKSRERDVLAYFDSGKLDNESNVMFGEGGAGAFSDGKLTTRIKDFRANEAVRMLGQFAGLPDIEVMAKPHIGTDKLKRAVFNMRRDIEKMGGTIHFSSRLVDIRSKDGMISAIRFEKGGKEEELACAACVLAIGQGARDTYARLHALGLEIVAKPFAVGVRIEHPRAVIDRSQFGAFAGHPRLGAAEYRLSDKAGDRGVYTFCMCPGGVVIASASGDEQAVTNGMSDHARDGDYSNAAIIAQVDARDFGSAHPLAGMRYQAELEKYAFHAGGGNGFAPASRVGDFLHHKKPHGFGEVMPTYRPGVVPTDLHAVLPPSIAEGVEQGIRAFSRKLKGFDMYDAVLTAVESRSSAPLRIMRDQNLESTRMRGLYPVGEGAGYAGGIVSAAVDGMKAAELLIGTYRV